MSSRANGARGVVSGCGGGGGEGAVVPWYGGRRMVNGGVAVGMRYRARDRISKYDIMDHERLFKSLFLGCCEERSN